VQHRVGRRTTVPAILMQVRSEGADPSFEAEVDTRRLTLRALQESDVDALASYRSNAEVCRWVPFEPMDAEVVRTRFEKHWSRCTLRAEGDLVFLGVELRESGVLIGDVMFRWSSAKHRTAEVGYVFHPAYTGNGYATEAAHGLLHVAFDRLGLHRVTARVDARNAASARVLDRLGMRREAHLLQNEWFKGAWADEDDFAILEHEWRAMHAAADSCSEPECGRATSP
jgi:RimJ/RimL family protein N-acetyltransferase